MDYLIEVAKAIKTPISNVSIKKTIKKALKYLKVNRKVEISVAFVDSKTIKQLNRQYKKINRITDVLSFSLEINSKFQIPDPKFQNYLGEIIICYPQAKKQAKEQKHSIKEEIKILLVHGLLHLLGYDHETEKEATIMEDLERKISEALKH